MWGAGFWRKAVLPGRRDKQRGCRETWHLQGAQRISWFQVAALPPHRAMRVNQQGNTPTVGTVWKDSLDQVTSRERNPKSRIGGEESRYELPVPGDNVSVVQLKATAMNRSGPNELWVQSLTGQLEGHVTPNPHSLSENEPKAKQVEKVTALSCKPQHRQALSPFPFLKIDFSFPN